MGDLVRLLLFGFIITTTNISGKVGSKRIHIVPSSVSLSLSLMYPFWIMYIFFLGGGWGASFLLLGQ